MTHWRHGGHGGNLKNTATPLTKADKILRSRIKVNFDPDSQDPTVDFIEIPLLEERSGEGMLHSESPLLSPQLFTWIPAHGFAVSGMTVVDSALLRISPWLRGECSFELWRHTPALSPKYPDLLCGCLRDERPTSEPPLRPPALKLLPF